MTLTLSRRLSFVFAALLLACCAVSAWLQVRANVRHEQQVLQRLSLGLASHIAANSALMGDAGVDAREVRDLFSKLMDVNPSVEVYLLDLHGAIVAHAAPADRLKRASVDVEPVLRLLSGARLPVLGDDPRSAWARNVFSAAPLKVHGRDAGYVYVVLLGEQHASVSRTVASDDALVTALWSMGIVAVLGTVAGLTAFRWITRPLEQLTADVHRLQADGTVIHGEPRMPQPGSPRPPPGDEIVLLRSAFTQMTDRIAAQWRDLKLQDQQRRELVANISHDLRTPLTSLHGYLETLRVKADHLSEGDRDRYLDVALGQSRKVNRLAEELFELARLEYGDVKPVRERFSLPELLQDVVQKFELSTQARGRQLVQDVPPSLPEVEGDLSMIERVLTNLLDNAIRHTPQGGRILVCLQREGSSVKVRVCDSGPGVPLPLRATLFQRPSPRQGRPSAGGLGLLIVSRILQLHGSEIRLADPGDSGAVFEFNLPAGAMRPGFG